jgi:hypothetical protein
MSKNVFCVALSAVLFVLSFSASAQQQAKKVHRIGFLVPGSPATFSAASRHCGKGCATWVMLRERTS